MVAIAIGLIVVIAIINVLSADESTLMNMLGEEQKEKKKEDSSNV